MKSVNLRTPKTFGERTNSSIKLEPKKKYFLVVEGNKTEVAYFNGIFNFRKELNIDDLIDIVVVEREEENKTDSHPLHLLNGILKQTGKVEVPQGYPKLEYDEDIDEIWLIFDRDPKNFFQNQFDEIYKQCNIYNFKIGLTNPNFEFWLLLHLPNVDRYSVSDLLENKKVNSKRRFIEKELSNRLTCGYNKKNIHFESFIAGVEVAIEQEKKFKQNVSEIFNELGSNIGILITKMKSS